VDRNGTIPSPADLVDSQGWLRPRLLGGAAVLLVQPDGPGRWRSIGGKSKGHGAAQAA
jgi:hypothetical protein